MASVMHNKILASGRGDEMAEQLAQYQAKNVKKEGPFLSFVEAIGGPQLKEQVQAKVAQQTRVDDIEAGLERGKSMDLKEAVVMALGG